MKLSKSEIEILIQFIDYKMIEYEKIWLHTPESIWPEDFDPNDIFVYKILKQDFLSVLDDTSMPLKKWKGFSILTQDLNIFLSSNQKTFDEKKIIILNKLRIILSDK